jgi:uncharacterized membrane protein YqjE
MATQNRFDPQIVRSDGGRSATDEPQMRDLLKQLAGEGTDLVRNEIALAKLEMREMAREVAADSAKVAAALGIALVGTLALVAAAIIGLGNLLDGRYALSALIVGVVMVAIGGVLASVGIKGLKNAPRPDETKRSLQRDKEWASREARQFKEGIRS